MSNSQTTLCEEYLHSCLYFASITLSRVITQMAEEEFRVTGLSPTYAFLVMLVDEHDGISQKELGKKLRLAPSTITRFIDKLEKKKLLRRVVEGKNSYIYAAESGRAMQDQIMQCWRSLYKRYTKIIGKKQGEQLTGLIDRVGSELAGGA